VVYLEENRLSISGTTTGVVKMWELRYVQADPDPENVRRQISDSELNRSHVKQLNAMRNFLMDTVRELGKWYSLSEAGLARLETYEACLKKLNDLQDENCLTGLVS
jgi:hypothetical protein